MSQYSFVPKAQVRELFAKAFAAGATLKVEFVKRTTAETRLMMCCEVPASQVRASARSDQDAAGADTIFVWDTEKQKPASVPVEAVLRIRLADDDEETRTPTGAGKW